MGGFHECTLTGAQCASLTHLFLRGWGDINHRFLFLLQGSLLSTPTMRIFLWFLVVGVVVGMEIEPVVEGVDVVSSAFPPFLPCNPLIY